MFSQGSTCLDLLWIPPCLCLSLTGLSPSLAGFPKTILLRLMNQLRGPNPRGRTLVWALSISLAATFGITVVFSSSGYLDVSVHRVPFIRLWIGTKLTEVSQVGFPIQKSPDQMGMCSSPKLFAAYHVLHRLLVPRHPPYALFRMTKLSFSTGMRTHLHLYSVICVGSRSISFLSVFFRLYLVIVNITLPRMS